MYFLLVFTYTFLSSCKSADVNDRKQWGLRKLTLIQSSYEIWSILTEVDVIWKHWVLTYGRKLTAPSPFSANSKRWSPSQKRGKDSRLLTSQAIQTEWKAMYGGGDKMETEDLRKQQWGLSCKRAETSKTKGRYTCRLGLEELLGNMVMFAVQ